MNIFILDTDLTKCAQYHVDKHVVKMITEHAQIMSTVCRLSGLDEGYGITHQHHPCVKWCNESLSNWRYLFELTVALHDEWRFRYGHSRYTYHKSYEVMFHLPEPLINPIGLTPFAQAMPDKYKSSNPVESYRNYYMGEKRHLANWKVRGAPSWWK